MKIALNNGTFLETLSKISGIHIHSRFCLRTAHGRQVGDSDYKIIINIEVE
jgi:hypothetical protein